LIAASVHDWVAWLMALVHTCDESGLGNNSRSQADRMMRMETLAGSSKISCSTDPTAQEYLNRGHS